MSDSKYIYAEKDLTEEIGCGPAAGGGLLTLAQQTDLNVNHNDSVQVTGVGATEVAFEQDTYDPDGSTNPSTSPNTPAMTSNSTPSGTGIVFDNGAFGGQESWRCFDQGGTGNSHDYASNNTPSAVNPKWVGFQYDVGTPVNKFGLTPRSTAYTSQSPVDFIIQGSLDDLSYDDLVTVVGESGWAFDTTKWYSCNNNTKYKYYRVRCTKTNGANFGLQDLILVTAAASGTEWVRADENDDFDFSDAGGVGNRVLTVTNISGQQQNIRTTFVYE